MTNLTPHASFENNTDIVRWSVDLRYQDAEIPNNIDEDPKDFRPERDPVTMACWPGEGDFVIKDAQNPAREITDIAEFKKIRTRYEETPRPQSRPRLDPLCRAPSLTNRNNAMRTYLEGCGVPTTQIGQAEIPRLIMGIHPYDGCSYQNKERDAENFRAFSRVQSVADVLRYAVEEGGITAVQVDHMLPELDRLHLQAIWETEQQTDTQLGMVAYILIPVTLDGEIVSYSERAHSTFYARNEALGGAAFREHFHRDDILRYNLGDTFNGIVTPETVPPYTEEDAARFEIDYGILEQYLGFFAGCDILIADPGAEIDLLAMTGRFDLIREYLSFLRQRFDTVITSVHHAGVTLPLLEAENIPVDGYLTTVNAPGTFMFPTRDMAIDAIKNASKPVIAIKPLAGGRYLGHKAFEYVFKEVGVSASMFGMGTLGQVRETTQAAREVLGV